MEGSTFIEGVLHHPESRLSPNLNLIMADTRDHRYIGFAWCFGSKYILNFSDFIVVRSTQPSGQTLNSVFGNSQNDAVALCTDGYVHFVGGLVDTASIRRRYYPCTAMLNNIKIQA